MAWDGGVAGAGGVRGLFLFVSISLATFQAAGFANLRSQGIGLRPQPWAGFCRPVGPHNRADGVKGRNIESTTHRARPIARAARTPTNPAT